LSRPVATYARVFAVRVSMERASTLAIVLARASRTSPAVLGGSICAASGCGGSAALRPCLDPIFAARSGSECRAHLVPPVTGHAPHRLPFLLFAKHFWDIV